MASIHYRTADVDGFSAFYRQAGNTAAPKLLLVHGFPSAGHIFRDLIPLLVDKFHVVAPDLPGFGQSAMPPHDNHRYMFDNLASVIERFMEVTGFDYFGIYIFDCGAPAVLRLAVRHPERISAILSQNGNAAIILIDPVRSPRAALLWILACVSLIFAGGWLIDAAHSGLSDLPVRLDWTHGVQCLWKMVALSIPPAIALATLIRRGASTDRAGTALAAGLASAAWGAFVFVFACPSDDPLYIAVWYTVGCGIVTALSRVAMLRLSRW